MSVKVHEAYSLDSMQKSLLWWDDFLGDQLQDEWRIGGTGTIAVIDQQTGGIVRLTSGAISGNTIRLYWSDIRTLLVANKVTLELRVKLNHNTNLTVGLRLHSTAVNEIYFLTTGGANWFINSILGGVPTSGDSGEALDTDYHVFRIECFPTGQVHFYIDGIETNNSPITTNIPVTPLQPEFSITTNENAAKSMDIDYIVIRQEV